MKHLLHSLSRKTYFLRQKGVFLNNTFALKTLPKEVLEGYSLRDSIDNNKYSHTTHTMEIPLKRSSITSTEIFKDEQGFLPCWADENTIDPQDDWLNASNYYPLYFDLYKSLRLSNQRASLLEIGVRTGYMGAVFTKAIEGNSFYVGLDPNLYIANGLKLASESLLRLKKTYPDSLFHLHYGFSSSVDTQYSLRLNDKFDFIHIDGDHTLLGKIIDLWLCKDLISDKGWIFVDDYDHKGIVPQAIEIAFRMGWYKKFSYIESHRGLAIIK